MQLDWKCMEFEAYVEMDLLEANHWWFVGRRAIIRNEISKLNLKNNSSILEVGAGTGGNLQLLSEFGNVVAIEMNEFAIELAKAKKPDNVQYRLGKFPENPNLVQNEKFDLICMFDVIEHIASATESLRILSGCLKENGKILLTVPSYNWLWSAHDDFNHHVKRYERRSFKNLIRESGLIIDRISHFNFILFPVAILDRLRIRLLERRTYSGMKLPNKLLNIILIHIFSFERKVLNFTDLPYGLSLLAVVKISK